MYRYIGIRSYKTFCHIAKKKPSSHKKSLKGPWLWKINNNTGPQLWKTTDRARPYDDEPSRGTDLVTLQHPVRAPQDCGRFHRIVVTASGQIAHESVDTGANAQPSTGRYTRSHSTVLDVFNNIGDRTAATCWSAQHTDTDRPATVAATHNGTTVLHVEESPRAVRGGISTFFLPYVRPTKYYNIIITTHGSASAVRQCVSRVTGDRDNEHGCQPNDTAEEC